MNVHDTGLEEFWEIFSEKYGYIFEETQLQEQRKALEKYLEKKRKPLLPLYRVVLMMKEINYQKEQYLNVEIPCFVWKRTNSLSLNYENFVLPNEQGLDEENYLPIDESFTPSELSDFINFLQSWPEFYNIKNIKIDELLLPLPNNIIGVSRIPIDRFVEHYRFNRGCDNPLDFTVLGFMDLRGHL